MNDRYAAGPTRTNLADGCRERVMNTTDAWFAELRDVLRHWPAEDGLYAVKDARISGRPSTTRWT